MQIAADWWTTTDELKVLVEMLNIVGERERPNLGFGSERSALEAAHAHLHDVRKKSPLDRTNDD